MPEIGSVTIIGLGYIGLPTAAVIAGVGISVSGLEVRPEVVDIINSGEIHITEHGLRALVHDAVASGRLRAVLTPQPSDAWIIAVPTPVNPDNSPDLSCVESATRQIADVLRPGDLVVVESTIPPGTCDSLVGPLLLELTGLDHRTDYYLAHCPERVIPGRIIEEIIHNDRVIGGTRPEATDRAAGLYAKFVEGELLLTDAVTAEMCKLAENTYRDVNIALANEFARISRELQINVYELIELANHHPRVNILQPGIGVGGHCIAVDPWFLVYAAPDEARLIRTAREINDDRPNDIVRDIVTLAMERPDAPVALLGLAYKADVDDIRESPAVHIVAALADQLSQPLLVVEPFARELPAVLSRPHVRLVALEEALAESAVVAALVAHRPFRNVPATALHGKLVADPLQIWAKEN